MPTEFPMASSSTSRLALNRPISDDAAVRSPPSKPQGGARILSFLLQALVMAAALSLFFLFAGVAALVLLHLFVAGRALRSRRRRFLLHHITPNPNPSRLLHDLHQDGAFALSQRDLKALPSFNYSNQVAAAVTSSDCAVCLEGFRVGDLCRNIPACGHSFHRDCVDRWLMKSPSCPICRRCVMPAVCG